MYTELKETRGLESVRWGLRKGADYRVFKAETTISSLAAQIACHYNLASLLLRPDGTVDPTDSGLFSCWFWLVFQEVVAL